MMLSWFLIYVCFFIVYIVNNTSVACILIFLDLYLQQNRICMSNYITSLSILEHFVGVMQRNVVCVSDNYISTLKEYIEQPRYVTSIDIVSSTINVSVSSILSFLRDKGIFLKEGRLSSVTEETLDILAELYVAKMKKYFYKTVFHLSDLNPKEYANLCQFFDLFSNCTERKSYKFVWDNIDCNKIKKYFFETVRSNTELEQKYGSLSPIYQVLVSYTNTCFYGACFRLKKITEILNKLIWSTYYFDNKSTIVRNRQFVSIVDFIIKPFRYHIFVDEDSNLVSVRKVVEYIKKYYSLLN